jgi:hypothetical protein
MHEDSSVLSFISPDARLSPLAPGRFPSQGRSLSSRECGMDLRSPGVVTGIAFRDQSPS